MTPQTPQAPQMSFNRLIAFLAIAIVITLASQIAANHYLASNTPSARSR